MKKIKLDNAEQMYGDLKRFCTEQDFENSLKSLPYAKKMHEGTVRRGSGDPFLIHPLFVAITLLNYGLVSDELIASALLHDTVEDHKGCNLSDLDILDSIKKRVYLLSFKKGLLGKKASLNIYMSKIVWMGDSYTNYIKDADRLHNLTTTKGAFTPQKLQDYIDETFRLFYPNFKYQKRRFPEGKEIFDSLENKIKKQIEIIKLENSLNYSEPKKGLHLCLTPQVK